MAKCIIFVLVMGQVMLQVVTPVANCPVDWSCRVSGNDTIMVSPSGQTKIIITPLWDNKPTEAVIQAEKNRVPGFQAWGPTEVVDNEGHQLIVTSYNYPNDDGSDNQYGIWHLDDGRRFVVKVEGLNVASPVVILPAVSHFLW